MYHNRAHLLKLELWIRLIGLYLLIGIGIKIFIIVAVGVNYWITPDLMNAYPFANHKFLFISGLVLKNLTGLLIPIFFYLLFLGVSYTIRYLLAMKDSISRSRKAASPVRSS
jgi:hypothetical protein